MFILRTLQEIFAVSEMCGERVMWVGVRDTLRTSKKKATICVASIKRRIMNDLDRYLNEIVEESRRRSKPTDDAVLFLLCLFAGSPGLLVVWIVIYECFVAP